MDIYLDHNATTAPHHRVIEAMRAVLASGPGNPSARHRSGRRALQTVEEARRQVAGLLGAPEDAIVFTGSGTEACNLALFGVFDSPSTGHLVISAQEHHAVLEAAAALEARGVAVTRIAPGPDGRVRAEAVTEALRPETRLVSVMHANNETGVLQPIEEIAAAMAGHPALLHTDAIQAIGKTAVDVEHVGIDLLSCSAHKLNGPQGVGASYIRDKSLLRPLIVGGGQEDGLRAGTTNVASIAGFGVAAELAHRALQQRSEYLEAMRAILEDGIRRHFPSAVIVGADAPRLTNTTLACFHGVNGADLAAALDQDGISVSTGAACTSDAEGISHVLEAMGMPAEVARGAVRFSLGHENTEPEMKLVLKSLQRLLGRRGTLRRS